MMPKPHISPTSQTPNLDKTQKRRHINETTVSENNPLALLQFRSSILCVAFKGFRLVALKFALTLLGLRLW